MIQLAIEYAFKIAGAEQVTIINLSLKEEHNADSEMHYGRCV